MLWEAVLDDLSKPNFPPQKLIKFFTKPLVGRQCYKLCLALLKLPSAEFAHASLPLYTCRKVYCAIGACLAISEEYWLCWWCPPSRRMGAAPFFSLQPPLLQTQTFMQISTADQHCQPISFQLPSKPASTTKFKKKWCEKCMQCWKSIRKLLLHSDIRKNII